MREGSKTESQVGLKLSCDFEEMQTCDLNKINILISED